MMSMFQTVDVMVNEDGVGAMQIRFFWILPKTVVQLGNQ